MLYGTNELFEESLTDDEAPKATFELIILTDELLLIPLKAFAVVTVFILPLWVIYKGLTAVLSGVTVKRDDILFYLKVLLIYRMWFQYLIMTSCLCHTY
jgi:hypothetical protein